MPDGFELEEAGDRTAAGPDQRYLLRLFHASEFQRDRRRLTRNLLAGRLDLVRNRGERPREVRLEVLKLGWRQPFNGAAINRMAKALDIVLLFERAIEADNSVSGRGRLVLGRGRSCKQYQR